MVVAILLDTKGKLAFDMQDVKFMSMRDGVTKDAGIVVKRSRGFPFKSNTH